MDYYYKHDLRGGLIKSIIKKTFSSEKPLEATTAAAQKALLQQIAAAVAPELNIKVTANYYQKFIGEFEIDCRSKFIANIQLVLQFNGAGILHLTPQYDAVFAPLSRAEDLLTLKKHILALIPAEDARCKAKKDAADHLELKNNKIKALKEAAIVAKIKELAEAEQVPYYIDTDFQSKVKLTIQLSRAERMEVDISYKNYQHVLQELQNAIRSVKELIAKSVPIKIKYSVQEVNCIYWTMPTKT